MYNVLIVDDEPLFRKMMFGMFNRKDLGYRVVYSACDGEDCLKYLGNESVNLIITDIRMPRMDGIALIKQLTVDYPNIFTVVLSAYNDFTLVREAFLNGANDYLLKPEIDRESAGRKLNEIKTILDERESLRNTSAILGAPCRNVLTAKAKQYIDKNYMKDISLVTVSEALHVSEGHLSRIFHKYMGLSFIDYLTSVRIEKAKYYLANTSYTLTEIADQVGYRSVDYFSRVFKKKEGKSPKQA